MGNVTRALRLTLLVMAVPAFVRAQSSAPAADAGADAATAAAAARAPGSAGSRAWAEMTAGSALESYVRVLQVAGRSPLYPVSLRGWSATERDSIVPHDARHPWASRMLATRARGSVELSLIRPEPRLVENSAWPYGSNDGAVWAGKGLTGAVHGGFELRIWRLTLVADPIVFAAQNLAFTLEPVSAGVRGAPFNDPVTPASIDLPQRFGSAAYRRADPGQSSLRLDLLGVAVGVSTANEIWGPAITSPIILGNNAAGIPRVFMGTSRPVNVGIGRVHARMMTGRLAQSDWSPTDTAGGLRLASALTVVFQPWGLENLEVGVARFFHRRWPSDGLSVRDFLIPFEGFLKNELGGKDNSATTAGTPDNQLASFFARIVLPRSGLEVYAEYGREDHSWDFRDLAGEPDHISAYTVGLQRVFASRSTEVLTALRAELSNARVTALGRGRGEGLFYQHSPVRQGHTQLGQLLGSPAIRGGGGGVLAVDRYTNRGRASLSLSRSGKASESEGGVGSGATSALAVDLLRFSHGFDLTVRAAWILDEGRNAAGDRSQLQAAVGARVPLGF